VNFTDPKSSDVAREGKWGYASRGASARFLQSFKNAFAAEI